MTEFDGYPTRIECGLGDGRSRPEWALHFGPHVLRINITQLGRWRCIRRAAQEQLDLVLTIATTQRAWEIHLAAMLDHARFDPATYSWPWPEMTKEEMEDHFLLEYV